MTPLYDPPTSDVAACGDRTPMSWRFAAAALLRGLSAPRPQGLMERS